MAVLGMTDREFEYHQKSISEAVRLIGQEADLFQISEIEEDLNSDKTAEYKDGRKVGLIFENNPRPILKKYQWLTEDEELPYVVYIVPLDFKDNPVEIRDDTLIRIVSDRVLESQRMFKITNVRGSTIDPLMWICKLVPHRPKVDFVPDTSEIDKNNGTTSDTGYKFLKREK